MDVVMLVLCMVFPLVLARNTLGLKQEYQGKIEIFDENFSLQIAKLSSLRTIEGVDYLGTVFGYVLLAAMVLNLGAVRLLELNLTADNFIPKALLVSLIGWISIKWYTQPHKYSINFLKGAVQLSSLALFMPLIDMFWGIPYTVYPYENLYKLMEFQGSEFPEKPHVLFMGFALFVMMTLFIVAAWLLTSVALLFVFALVFSGSYFSLKACSIAETYFGKQALNFFLILGFFGTQVYAWYS